MSFSYKHTANDLQSTTMRALFHPRKGGGAKLETRAPWLPKSGAAALFH